MRSRVETFKRRFWLECGTLSMKLQLACNTNIEFDIFLSCVENPHPYSHVTDSHYYNLPQNEKRDSNRQDREVWVLIAL